jgi:hypothetical protein
MIQFTAFECEFCHGTSHRKRIFRRERACRSHEKECYRNPATRSCATCGLWTDENGESYSSLPRECQGGHQPYSPEEGSRLTTNCNFWKPIEEDL